MRSFRHLARQALARGRLRNRTHRLGKLARAAMLWPRGDWLRLVRETRGETLKTVGARLGITAGSVLRVEANESRGSIQMATLRRVADALDCDLLYALVPRSTENLEEAVVRRQRRQELARRLDVIARRGMGAVDDA